MNQIPDHPVIQAMERTGWPDGREPEMPRCPVCGEACETIYFAWNHDIVGCDGCLDAKNAWEVDDCFPGKENE